MADENLKTPICHESRLLIVGLGLIGGSLAAALRESGFKGQIAACDPDGNEIALGIEMGLIDTGGTQLFVQMRTSSID